MEMLPENFIKIIPDSKSIGLKGKYDIILNYYPFSFQKL